MQNKPDEEKLEPLARFLRFGHAIKHLPRNRKIKFVDLGCGPTVPFYKFTNKRNVNFDTYFAIDPLINKEASKNYKIKAIKQSILKLIPLPDNSIDHVFASAVIEHVDYPEQILNECLRILKKDGTAIFTTPTTRAKKLLEFLSFKLNLISKKLMLEHKQYFTPESLGELLQSSPYPHSVSHQYFEFGLNNLFVIKKL